MAQHKAAMERIFREDVEANNNDNKPKKKSSVSSSYNAKEDDLDLLLVNTRGNSTLPPPSTYHKENNQSTDDDNELSPLLTHLQTYSAVLMMPILPLLWIILFVSTMDRTMLYSSYAMPLLGICSASLANAVPVGGGIVFVPILSLFGVKLSLGTAFAVSTMTFGNGVFGFLTWLRKDPSSIAWRVVPCAVLPAWVGATLGTLRPFLTTGQCRHLFGFFCVVVGIVVLRGIYQNQGRNDDLKGRPFSIVENNHHIIIGDDGEDDPEGSSPSRQKILACCFSFLAGLILVPHIGIGNAMTTFLVCSFVWRLPAKPSVVTGILVGGWTSLVPFLLHLFVLQDIPIALWVMGLPGVYLGARIAPLVHEKLGITNVLIAFVVFLFGTAALMLFRPT
uniref:Membrane transporter protein n=1 Tax=Ditylum brightwellii TaxID=49249 RepID=A0A7S4T0H4_9STRA